MIEAGTYHTLTVSRISDFGLYLTDGESEVLLPNRYVSLEDKVGDQKKVFVYHDSEDRLVATTETPSATVGQAAFLRVVDKSVHGAFLDWGLSAKDLFLPNRNMAGRLEPGESYVVYVYRDRVTGRAVATMQLRDYIRNEEPGPAKGEEVDILVAVRTEHGYRVVVNDRWWGMVYDNQLFSPLSIGDRTRAFVRKVTEDNRIDLSLQKEGYDEVQDSAGRLVDLLRSAGGFLALHDRSEPQAVSAATGMSKKVFKRTAGYLMKRGTISMDDKGIRLTEEE
ncbi:MAG: S1-like domain-containing RNA-binding protein [Alistipes sp.]|nr:S1-like domain-containing RNA-binding protein [Alistipes sp.]